MQRPIFLLVSGDGLRLDALRDDLSRRYQADYQVSVAGSAAAALTMLAVQAGSDAEVALVIADERLADMPAVDFLARAHGLHPGAKRILLINDGPLSGSLRPRARRHRHPPGTRIPERRARLTAGTRSLGGGFLLREHGDELGSGADVELAVDLAQVELDRLG